jgi:pimeloyl-ACP methyl ester carboxylesterase
MLWQAWDSLKAADAAAARRAVRPAVAGHGAGDDASAAPRPAWHEFAGVGHAPMLVQPEQRQAVRDFLLSP